MKICMKMKRFLIVVFVTLMCCVGCDGGGGNSGNDGSPFDKKPDVTPTNIQNKWQGTIDWGNGNLWQINSLDFYQENNTITHGRLQATLQHGASLTIEDVTGTVNGSTAEIRAVFQDSGVTYELRFNGNLTESTYNGEIELVSGDQQVNGTFSLTKSRSIDPISQQTAEIGFDTCFTFATETVTPGNCSDDGDMYLYNMGGRADISSNGNLFCPQEGTHTSLESIPSDYSDCDWTYSIEGNGTPIDNTGYIVRDTSLNHHYKMWIIKNGGGTLTFEYEQID